MGLTFFDDERLARDVYAAVSFSAGGEEAASGISRQLAPIVAHDGLCLRGTDPVLGTELCWFSFWHGYEPALASPSSPTASPVRARAGRPARPGRTAPSPSSAGGRTTARRTGSSPLTGPDRSSG
ncbi:hypothetical protein ACFYU9_18040 [Streptomyces sp. NPDC004327]|uniref:hypothetical protein n=1 Tax=Streptomyces sp. NPDC004327 TaxID=3364699 RepID=UPI0036D0E9D8